MTLVPAGTADAGLIAGRPARRAKRGVAGGFLARLHGLPRVEVVNLVSTQAYRYSHIGLTGLGRAFDLYVIPATGAGARVMACFAPERLIPAIQQCERIVSGVALTGPPPATLTPEPIYAKQLSSVLGSLDAERARARKEMGSSASASKVATAASTLASNLSSASQSLAALQAPQLVAPAGAALAAHCARPGRPMEALADAARAESLSGYDEARSAVGAAETRVDAALANIALLGYGAGCSEL